MTVKEMIASMIGAFRGFDANAVTAMAPVFQRKLERYEGAELANAWVEVAASFRPTGPKPYPVPSDFEDVLPQAAKLPKGASGNALDMKGHALRKSALLEEWRKSQAPQIAQEYGTRVVFWCEHRARDKAQILAWDPDNAVAVRLKREEIAEVFESVSSRDRMATFGVYPLGRADAFDLWHGQMEQCRAYVRASLFSFEETPRTVARRTKKSGPVFEAEPEYVREDVPIEFDGVPEN